VILVSDLEIKYGKTVIPVDLAPWESAFFVFDKKGLATATPQLAEADHEVKVLGGKWKMRLEGHGFKTLEQTVSELQSWTEQPRTRHFSGTGVYEKEFTLPAKEFDPDKRWVLDLGEMKNIAEVELNGIPVGVDWIAPYEMDISHALRNGKNQLRIKVTNTLINHVTSMKEVPPVPEELWPRLGVTNPELSKERAYRNPPKEFSEKELPLSGLVGPVVIRSSR